MPASLAICAVVTIHTNAEGIAGVWIRPHVNYCVALFIFLSGYLTKIDSIDWRILYGKRIRRVLYPYLIWTLIYSVVYKSPLSFGVYVLTGSAAAPFYFFLVYIQFVLLTPVIARLLRSRIRRLGWLITPVTILLARYLPAFTGVKLGFPFPAANFLVWFSFFYFGLAIGNGILSPAISIRKYVLYYSLALVFSTVEGIAWYNMGNMDMATTQIRLSSFLSSMMACLLAYSFIARKSLSDSTISRVLAKIGDYSFGIMLSHMLIIRIIDKAKLSFLFFPLKTILTIGLSFVIAYAGNRLSGKNSKLLGFV